MKYLFALLASLIFVFFGPDRRQDSSPKNEDVVYTGAIKSNIPTISIDADDPFLIRNGGVWHYEGKRFSGILMERFPNGQVKSKTEIKKGRRHGTMERWYANGQLQEQRHFDESHKIATHSGWFENGNPKFVYHFENDQHEGEQKEWYSTGALFSITNFESGKEVNLKRFAEDGKIISNYIVKGGRRFGLIGKKSCYSVAQ